MPAIHIVKRSHHLPLIFCGFDAVTKRNQEFQHVFHVKLRSEEVGYFTFHAIYLLSLVFLDCRTLTDTVVLKFFVLFCTSCQKKTGIHWLIGFLFQRYVYEFVWVHCFSLIPHTVPGERSDFHFYQVCFFSVFSCSLLHHTVTKVTRCVTSNGSLYEPSHQGWIYSVTASIPSSTRQNLKVDFTTFFFFFFFLLIKCAHQ